MNNCFQHTIFNNIISFQFKYTLSLFAKRNFIILFMTVYTVFYLSTNRFRVNHGEIDYGNFIIKTLF